MNKFFSIPINITKININNWIFIRLLQFHTVNVIKNKFLSMKNDTNLHEYF